MLAQRVFKVSVLIRRIGEHIKQSLVRIRFSDKKADGASGRLPVSAGKGLFRFCLTKWILVFKRRAVDNADGP